MTEFTESRRDLIEVKTFRPVGDGLDHTNYDKTIRVTGVTVEYALRNYEQGDPDCTEKVTLTGQSVLKSGKLGGAKVIDLWHWQSMQRHRAWEQPEWLVRLVEDNRPEWWVNGE